MRQSDVEQLARAHVSPGVTIQLPTQRERPGNAEDPLTLRHLVDRATDRLLRDYERREIAPLVERLESAAGKVDFAHPGAGLAILAAADQEHVLVLPFAPPERVVIDERFATRDLLMGVHREHPYRVLVLSAKRCRLLEGAGATLVEVKTGGFPLEVSPPREEDTPHKDLPIHESQRDEAYRFVFRAVDRALDDIHGDDPLPIVLVGVERDLSFFRSVTKHDRSVVAQVTGNHVTDSPADLARPVTSVVTDYLAERDARAVSDLIEAVGTGRAVLGIEDVHDRAAEGRGRLLVVDDDFRSPAPEATGDRIDSVDAVDLAAESVLSTGGEVTFVAPGSLAEHGGIGLLLRF